MGIAIWLVPSQDHCKLLRALMNIRAEDTAKTHAASSFPSIVPHITLASVPTTPVDALSTLLSSNRIPLIAKFATLEVGAVYFRSVYLAIQLSPQLSRLHADIHSKLAIIPKTPAFPHLSLAYIDDNDLEERNKYAKALWAQGIVRNSTEGGVAIKDDNAARWIEQIDLTEAWLVQCIGPVEEWEVLERVDLAG